MKPGVLVKWRTCPIERGALLSIIRFLSCQHLTQYLHILHFFFFKIMIICFFFFMGNSLNFKYCKLTNNWNHYVVLWSMLNFCLDKLIGRWEFEISFFNVISSLCSTLWAVLLQCSPTWIVYLSEWGINLIVWILSFVTFIVSNQWNSCYRPAFGKLYPAGHIWPLDCSAAVCKLRLVFAFLNGWKNLKEV